jgi:hypothetical protein
MAKYNAKKTPVTPTETNLMGEMAFKMSDKEKLVSTVMTTFLQDSYYEKETETVNRIQKLLDKVDPLFAAKLAVYARNEGNLRSVTHLISAYIAKAISGTDWGKRFYSKIVVRPDDMSEILSCYAHLTGNDDRLKKIPNSIKKGFKEALERLDAYQIDKYKMKNRNLSLVDLVNLFHPAATQKNAEAYRRLINGESLDGLYASKIFEKEMSAAGQKTKGATVEEKEKAKEEAITAVLDNVKGMPIMNLLRNLCNILLYAPSQVEEACKQLRIENKIKNSRLLPFRFATAYGEIEKLSLSAKGPKTEIAFESDKSKSSQTTETFEGNKKKVLDAIEDAIQISCLNIPKLDGNVAVLIDHSGSVRGDAGGHSRVSAFSKTTSAMIGNLFGSMLAYRQENVYVGLFGDRLISVPMDRSKKLLDFNKESYNIGAKCGGGTETGIYDFLRAVVKEKKKVDNVVVFSDCEIGTAATKNSYYGRDFTAWYGTSSSDRGDHFHELFKEFRKINPQANFIVCNLRESSGTSVFDKSQRILNIAGWSDKIFDIITSNCKGWDAMIKEIEAIEI